MKPLLILLLSLLSVSLASCDEKAETTSTVADGETVTRHIIVMQDTYWSAEASEEEFTALASDLAAELGVNVAQTLQLIGGFVSEGLSPADVERISADPRVDYVEEDGTVTTQ